LFPDSASLAAFTKPVFAALALEGEAFLVTLGKFVIVSLDCVFGALAAFTMLVFAALALGALALLNSLITIFFLTAILRSLDIPQKPTPIPQPNLSTAIVSVS
jgi:hypothetical protein